MNLKLIIKGFIVGIGKIIPGISGSMLAFTLGIYEDIINALTSFFSNPKKHFQLLFNFGIGVVLAIILFSNLILFFLKNYYIETIILFLGLILGTLIPFSKKLTINKKNIILFLLVFFFLLLTMNILSLNFTFTGTLLNYLWISLLGFIDAFTSIVPGISGTAIFMMLGAYEEVLTIISNPISLTFIIYGSGLMVGIVITSYIMNYFLKKMPSITYSIIFAFMFYSLYVLFCSLTFEINIMLIILFIIGVIVGFLFDK